MLEPAPLLPALLAAAVWSCACAPSSSPPPAAAPVTVPSSVGAEAAPLLAAEPAPPVVAPPRLAFQVSAQYLATVLYALDRAASSRGPDERYRRWLFGDAAAPAWFEAYAARRARWRTSGDSGDGPYDTFAACSYGVATLDALLDCAAALLAEPDLEVARVALEQTNELLWPRWVELEPVLSRRQRELEALTGGTLGAELAGVLAKAAQLPQDEQLTFEVVLVAKPPGDVSRGHQSGRYLVVEVLDQRPASRQCPSLFHEIAHLAARHAPGRAELERSFVGRGLPGLIAANLWDETFATAFGNGLAARALDPTFSPDRSLYQDDAIDALGRALYFHWVAGNPVTLDATLAEQLLALVASTWPRERWRMVDLLGRLLLLSEDREEASILQQGLRPRSLYQLVPLPAELSVPAELSSLPRVVLATLGTLQSRPELLQLFGLEARNVGSRLSAHGSSLYWRESEDELRVLVTAKTHEGLVQATRSFAELQRPPGPGWTAL